MIGRRGAWVGVAGGVSEVVAVLCCGWGSVQVREGTVCEGVKMVGWGRGGYCRWSGVRWLRCCVLCWAAIGVPARLKLLGARGGAACR